MQKVPSGRGGIDFAEMKATTSLEATCVVCGGHGRPIADGRDYLYRTTRRAFQLRRCAQCKGEYIAPPLSAEEVVTFYPTTYYSYQEGGESFFAQLREDVVDSAYGKAHPRGVRRLLVAVGKRFLDGVPLRIFGEGRFLDVGCGSGANLKLLARHGWKAEGFEIGAANVRDDNIHVAPSLADANIVGSFDYVRVWHVIEHVPDPHGFLETLRKLTDKQGRVVFGLPNCGSLYARVFGRYWYNRDIPRHVFNYRPSTLRRALADHGFDVTRMTFRSCGGLLGSIQHILNRGGRNIDLINRSILVLLFWPFDLLCDALRVGDSIVVEARLKNEGQPSRPRFHRGTLTNR